MDNDIFDLESAMNSHADMEYEAKEVTLLDHDNSYLSNPEKGLKLCASLIAKEATYSQSQSYLTELEQQINQDFVQFANADENSTGVKTYNQLLHWLQRVKEASYFPRLEQCHTVAVGGSFSAGKTRFLNTVLGYDSLLPTDTKPTTSIPTYLLKFKQDSINALNFYGKKTAIDEDALQAICHAFRETYDVTFSHILQMVVVERSTFKYDNLIFLDTPGYSKADNIHASENNTDENIAREHLRSADYLIWLVDNQNGTVPKPDLDFLQSLAMDSPILVVFSKADKKTRAEIEKIIEVAKSDLTEADIAYLDVIGYSSETKSEVSTTGSVLADYLNDINQQSLGSTLAWELNKIMDEYIHFYDSKDQMLKLSFSSLQELLFSEVLEGAVKDQLETFHKKTKEQRNNLFKQKDNMLKLKQSMHEILADFAQCLDIPMAEKPSRIQFLGMQKDKKDKGEDSATYQFNANLSGNIDKLSAESDLNTLSAQVIKVTPVMITIQIDNAPELDVVMSKRTIQITAPSFDYQSITVGEPVQVQIVSHKKANITITR